MASAMGGYRLAGHEERMKTNHTKCAILGEVDRNVQIDQYTGIE